MIAIDTNILVRFITRDDPVQVPIADRLMRSGAIRVSPLVLLQTAWVLDRFYQFDDHQILDALTMVLDVEAIHVPRVEQVRKALGAARAGLDLDDAMIWADTPNDVDLATFDDAFARNGARIAPPHVFKPS